MITFCSTGLAAAAMACPDPPGSSLPALNAVDGLQQGRLPLILVHGNHNESHADAGWGALLAWARSDSEFRRTFQVWNFIHNTCKPIGFDGTGNATELGDLIRRQFDESRPIALLAHSRGGLVARAYMSVYGAGDQGDRVLVLLTLATPHHGAVGAVPDWGLLTIDKRHVLNTACLANLLYNISDSARVCNAFGERDIVFNVNRLGSTDLAWDNFEGPERGIPVRGFHIELGSIALGSDHVLSPRDANGPVLDRPEGEEDNDLHDNNRPHGTLSELNADGRHLSKIIAYGGYFSDPSKNVSLLTLRSRSDDPHVLLSYAGRMIAAFQARGQTVSDIGHYIANDGLVPLQSAIFLRNDSSVEYLYAVNQARIFGVSLLPAHVKLPLELRDLEHVRQVRRTRIFSDHDHLHMLHGKDDNALFLAIKQDLLTLDTDNDGLADAWEFQHWGNLTTVNDPNADFDGDALSNLEEFQRGTNPALADTDGDGFSDKAEVEAGTDPLDPNSRPLAAGPILLAQNLNGPFSLALDQTHVYWAESLQSAVTVKKLSVDGGTPMVLAEEAGTGSPTDVEVNGGFLYWSATPGFGRGSIHTVGVGGGETVLLAGGNQPSDIAVDGAFVYWSECNGGPEETQGVRRVPINGGEVETLTLLGLSCALDVDATHVYFGYFDFQDQRAKIGKVSKAGGEVTVLALAGGGADRLTVSGGHVYWADQTSGAIRTVGVTGGPVTTLATGLNLPAGLAVDGMNVYWTEHARGVRGAGAVKKVDIAGLRVRILATDLNSPFAIRVGGGFVYWTELGTTGGDGTVKKLRIAPVLITFHTVAMSGDPAPGTAGTFFNFFTPALNALDRTAFHAALSLTGPEGIWKESSSGLVKVALSGDPAPGAGTFTRFGDASPALNALDHTAFTDFTGGGARGGIWKESSSGLGKVASTGDPAPGTDRWFFFFCCPAPALNALGHTAFFAPFGVPGRNEGVGIWAEDPLGALSLVVKTGDMLEVRPSDFRTITFVRFGSGGLNDSGQVAFLAGFSDGSQGVFVASFQVPP